LLPANSEGDFPAAEAWACIPAQAFFYFCLPLPVAWVMNIRGA